jgi:hypothetical protein
VKLTVPPPPGVTLELAYDEALLVRAALGRIDGITAAQKTGLDSSRAAHLMRTMWETLKEAGF